MSLKSSRQQPSQPRAVHGNRFRWCLARPSATGEDMEVDRPVVVALGAVDPGLVTNILGAGLALVTDPSADDLARAVGAIVRADAVVDATFLNRAPRLRVLARTGVGVDLVDLAAATGRGIPVVVTPGSGTRAVAEGVLALTLHLVKRLAA